MNFSIEEILLGCAILLFISILASNSFGRLGVPALILFLGVGIMAGSEGLGGIYFDDPKLAQSIGIVALTFILFSGGLDTRWEAIKPVTKQGIILSTFGVLITALSVGLFVAYIFDFTLLEGFLLGAVVSSTDAAAVFSILRTKSIGLKGSLRPMLELESGSNDPMAYFLTILFIFLIQNPDTSIPNLVLLFFQQMILGGAAGVAMGYVMPWITNRMKLLNEGLYPVLTISLLLITFAATSELGGNGFLATYIAGVVMGNRNFIHKKSLMRFYDGIAWLMQIMMFLTLGLFVFPSQILPVVGTGLLIAFFLMFIARPLSVFLCLAFFKHSFQELVFISWVGLRGAAPILFATYPLLAGVSQSDTIFNLVFFIVLTSVMLQGSTISRVAKWLGLAAEEPIFQKHPIELELSDEMKNELFEVELPETSKAAGKALVSIGFPKNSLIVLINRGGKYITPNGTTVLEPKDKLMIMTDDVSSHKAIQESLDLQRA